MVESIIKSFDIWTDAQGVKSKGRVKSIDNISLEGIAHLRELILELAIRGKLVPQDPKEEALSNLLIKKGAQVSKLVRSNLFKIPTNWEWWLLSDLGTIASSSRVHQKDWQSNGIPFYRAREIVVLSNLGRVDNELFISEELYNKLKEKGTVPEHNDIMITGVGTIGVPYVVKKNDVFYFKDASVLIFKNTYNLYTGYLNLFLNSQFWNNEIHRDSMGTTVDTLTIVRAKAIPIPLPPLPEQHRIVTKVEELMALCDELEREKTASLKTHQTLVAALLQTLTGAKGAGEVEKAWHRLAPHFNTLFCTEDSIDQLKQTILQLAIMGRLVKQDPADEPASELLKRIEKEKEKLIKDGKIKKEKPLPEIEDGEKPFALPSGWEFVRLSDLCELITKGSSPKWQGVSYVDNENEVLFITSENVGSFKMLLENRKYVETKFNKMEPRSILKRGDFLMNIVGGSIGRTAVFDLPDLANINQAVCLIRAFIKFLDYKYLLYFFNSEICISYMFDKQVDNARANLSMGNISKFVIPVPPIDEQRKIVAKVEELIALCDSLNEKVLKSQEIQNTLSKTIVENAVA